MPPKSPLSQAPPFPVESAIKQLAYNLQYARRRRNITISKMAAKLGVDRHVISDAEGGKTTTSIGVYVGLLWAMGLLKEFEFLADPSNDQEGIALSKVSERKRARMSKDLDNDF